MDDTAHTSFLSRTREKGVRPLYAQPQFAALACMPASSHTS